MADFKKAHWRDSQPHLEASRLTQRQINMANMLKESEGKRSLIAPLYFSLGCFGKLIFGFGASLAVKGIIEDDSRSTIIGSTVGGIGFVAIVFVAFGFGAACSRIDRARGIIFKTISISAAIFIAFGYAINQYFVSEHSTLLNIRLSIFPLWLGGAMLTISLPNFTAYTELVRGRTTGVPHQHRAVIAMSLIGCGLGFVFSGWITGEKGEWPIAFNAVVLTGAMAALYCGAAIFWSDALRREAQWAQSCILLDCKPYQVEILEGKLG